MSNQTFGGCGLPVIISADNINGAFQQAMEVLRDFGEPTETRNGEAWVIPYPVITHYDNPRDRVLFSSVRDANPFFHFMESLWMLAGRRDVAFLERFNSTIGQFSDDSVTLNGAYGYRWINEWEIDQIEEIVSLLKQSPESRRAVLEMWSVADLTEQNSKDLPCNTHVYFDLRGGKLNMTVCNRSNDAVWGCYGANVVHFSVLQEYVAGMLEVEMGWYCQMSNNLHIYTNVPNFDELIDSELVSVDSYKDGVTVSRPMFDAGQNPLSWDNDLETFINYVESNVKVTNTMNPQHYTHSFFSFVAEPMFHAWLCYKEDNLKDAITEYAVQIEAEDWKDDCLSWLGRRVASRKHKDTCRADNVKESL